MLVVSRKKSERVIVTLPDGRFVTVEVVRIENRRVRLGFDAPADVAIVREEIVREEIVREEISELAGDPGGGSDGRLTTDH